MFSLIIGMLAFGAMGAVMLIQPQLITRVTNVELSTPESRSEAMAVYGGFGVAIALALFIGLVWSPLRGGIQMTTGLALLGMAAGRGYAAFREWPTSPVIWGLLAAEAILGFMIFFRV